MKKSDGNMYEWVTHTHSHLAGECPHKCGYCYVQAMAKRFPNMKKRYSGDLRLIEGSLEENFGEGNTIFIDHLNDLWANDVPDEIINDVLNHCRAYCKNKYVFQTKNPMRYEAFRRGFAFMDCYLGTTIETNRKELISKDAPTPIARLVGMYKAWEFAPTFITIEPILDFDVEDLLQIILLTKPAFVNIGADSKGHGLQEPSKEKILELIDCLQVCGIEIRQKSNLGRIIG